jgi:hypothetical protein
MVKSEIGCSALCSQCECLASRDRRNPGNPFVEDPWVNLGQLGSTWINLKQLNAREAQVSQAESVHFWDGLRLGRQAEIARDERDETRRDKTRQDKTRQRQRREIYLKFITWGSLHGTRLSYSYSYPYPYPYEDILRKYSGQRQSCGHDSSFCLPRVRLMLFQQQRP